MKYWVNGKEVEGEGWDEYYLEQMQYFYEEDIYDFKELMEKKGIKIGNFEQEYMEIIKQHYISKKELRIKEEKSINDFIEKIELLDKFDAAIEDFVPVRKRINIFNKGLEVISSGEEGKKQLIKAFNKLVAEYNLGQERERKLFN